MATLSVLDRIMARVVVRASTQCWEYPVYDGQGGYGVIRVSKQMKKVHRVAFEMILGPLMPNAHLHHRCENKACCNPDHLVVTAASEHVMRFHPENIASIHAAKTHCKHGHPLTADNLYAYNAKRGERACKVCHRVRYKAWFERNKEKVRAQHKQWYKERGREQRMAAREAR